MTSAPASARAAAVVALLVGRTACEPLAPVQVDHHDVGLSAGGADRGDQRAWLAAWAAAMPGLCGPAAQTLLDPSRRDPSPPRNASFVPRTDTRYGVKAARRSRPIPTTGTGPLRIAAQGVAQADATVVGAVVVRHRHHVDAGGREDVQGRG